MPSDRLLGIEDQPIKYSFRDEGNLAEIMVPDKDKLWAIVESICSDLGSPLTERNKDYFFNQEIGGELRPGGAFSVRLYKPGVIWARVQNGRGEPNTLTLRSAVEKACAK